MAPVSFPFQILMQRWSLLINAFVLLACVGNAQIILPGKFIDERYPLFNDSIIAQEGIENITIRVMRKPSSSPIYDDGRRITYHFNELGRLISFQKVFPSIAGRVDTSSLTFIYRNDILQARSEKIGKYRKRISFDYINTHHIVETIKVKHGGMDWDELGKEEVKRNETRSDEQILISELRGGVNESAYQQTIKTLTADRHPIKKEVWFGSRLSSSESFEYSNGLLSSYSLNNPQKGSSIKIDYDTSSLLQEEGEWCEYEVCKNWSIVYYDTGLPKAFILMNTKTQDMEIWEYRYSYR